MKFEFRLNVALFLQTVCYRIRYKIIKKVIGTESWWIIWPSSFYAL
jgi:hypothetical protein